MEDEFSFRLTFDKMLEGIQIHDFDWKYIYVNDALLNYSQYSREELLGYTVMEKYPGIEQTHLFSVMQRCMNERVHEQLTTEFVFPNGEKAYFELSIQPVPQGIFILSINITERMKAEEMLRLAEESYRTIFDNATDAIFVYDLKSWEVIGVNQKAIDSTGFTKEELIGSHLQNIISNEYHSLVFSEYLHKAASGIPQVFEYPGKRKDNSVLWFEVQLKKVTLGGEDRVIAFLRDISDRKKSNDEIRRLNEVLEKNVSERTTQLERNIRQLKESEEKFQKVFQANAAGIAITRLPSSQYMDVNESFIQLVGYTKEELIGHTSLELGLIVNIEQREEVLNHIKEHGYARNFEVTIRHKSGKILEVLSSAETILINGENYTINIIFDITERKHAEQQLKAVNKELESFSYSVSHDLRSPLRAINGYAQILKEEYSMLLDEQGKRFLEMIRSNAVRMANLIDNLLEFSRLGRTEIRKTKTDMNFLVQSVLSEINKSVHHAEVRIDQLPSALVAPELLYHVWSNLISNAIKYSSQKQNPVVEITSESNDKEVIFMINDNGAGFDERYSDKLFGVFQRLHNHTEFEGTGVGLAIVERIVTRHGGRVWAEGVVNQGAKFYFSIPQV